MLPTPLERDTLLTPLWVAESVVQEVERFLKAELPAGFAERLAKRRIISIRVINISVTA